MDLEVAGADRHLEPVAVAARLLRTPAPPATRRGRRSEACAAAAACRGRARAAPARPRAPSARAAAARRAGPGSTTTGVPCASTTRPGAVPASPRQIAPAGSVACLRTPSAKSAYGRFSRSATSAGEALDLRLELRRRRRARARRPCADDLDGAVVVRRARARPSTRRDPPTRAPRAAPPRARRDRRRRSRSAPARARARAASARGTGPFRSVRSPRTSSLPVTTITARGRPAPEVNWRRRRRSSSPSRRRPAP